MIRHVQGNDTSQFPVPQSLHSEQEQAKREANLQWPVTVRVELPELPEYPSRCPHEWPTKYLAVCKLKYTQAALRKLMEAVLAVLTYSMKKFL